MAGFHPGISGDDAESLLLSKETDGCFLIRPSQHYPGDFTLSVKTGSRITHVRIQNQGEFYDLYGGETFATLGELVQFYMDNPGKLREKNGSVITLSFPVESHVAKGRWYHGEINGRHAEHLLMSRGREGSYIVRSSARMPGNFVLSSRVGDDVLHVVIHCRNGKFDVGHDPKFDSLPDLIDYYKRTPVILKSGHSIYLKAPFKTTSFLPSHITSVVAEMEVQNQDVYGKSGFWEEFDQMQQQECRNLFSRKVGNKPENRPKNRFKNILPFDSTRVVLSGSSVADGDYINANFINGEVPGSERFYIATQGCLPSTIIDFWQMIWQSNSMILVMLTKEVEKDRVKCSRYWPLGEARTYGEICVTPQDTIAYPNYIVRQFEVHVAKDDTTESGRHVFQFHLQTWPNHGVPNEPEVLVSLLRDVNVKRKEIEKLNPGPIVVHCGAGIGRTGTYIVLDIIIRAIEHYGWDSEIDVQRSVQLVRTQRSGMVQTEVQYKYLYTVLLNYIETMSGHLSDRVHTPVSDEVVYSNIQPAPPRPPKPKAH